MTTHRFTPRSCFALGALLCAIVASRAIAQGGPPPAPVRVDAVRLESITEGRMVTGDLRPVRRSVVASQEAGLVLAMPVRIGQRVETGELLARLDPRRLELALAEAQADLEAASAAVAERTVELEWQQEDLDLLIETSELAAATPKEMLDARSAVNQAEARLEQASRLLAVIESRIDLLEERLADTTIVAPFAGVVLARNTEIGEWVGEGAAVATLLEIDTIEAWINVPQALYDAVAAVSRATEGDSAASASVQVQIDATGALAQPEGLRLLPEVDPLARTFTVIAHLSNPEGHLAPGMSVTAWVPTGVTGEHLTVHKNAILRNDTGEFAYVVRGDMVLPARLRILFPAGERYIVESGELRPGDQVVTEGNERLFPTAPVSVIQEEFNAETAESAESAEEEGESELTIDD